jgi:hypothetical protein
MDISAPQRRVRLIRKRPRQDRDEAGRDRSLVGSCGVSRLTALADQAGINDFERAALPLAVCPKSNWGQLSRSTRALR